MSDLASRLAEAARSPVLLVACDYDGTLAPIVDNPADAAPHRESLVALKNLSDLPHTHVAVISGRALRDLAGLLGEPGGAHLVGSHGSEFDLDFTDSVPGHARALLHRVTEELHRLAGENRGFLVETKPSSVAFHYRSADPAEAERVLREVLDGPALFEGVTTRHGKKVVELGVLPTNKGLALQTLRQRFGVSSAIFIGDDLTDEDAFRTLGGPDIGVKVGSGETAAEFRVDTCEDVARLLANLSELRSSWVMGGAAHPIERHSMLSDQRTIALVTGDARITWHCAPRIDSPAVFAELLGGPTEGYFAVRPAGEQAEPPRQRYLGATFTLETRWPTLTVTDYLDTSGGLAWRRAGRSNLVRVLEGSGEAIVEFAPRPDFGRTIPHIIIRDGGLEVEGLIDPISLAAPGVEWSIRDEGGKPIARATVDLSRGPVCLEMRYGVANPGPSVTQESERRAQTSQFWESWANTLRLPPIATEHVRRSALVLRALCYGPTGAIAAAATTSLPESIGGVRNWDYRFCWPRDAALSASALVRLGNTGVALRFLDWMLGVLGRCDAPERLAPIYSVSGEGLGIEGEIGHLPGYAGSRPVRVGNSAAAQVQLDVFGPIVQLVADLYDAGAALSSQHWRLVEAMVHAVERRWKEPDHGIWEIRGPMRQHVHSKSMCWLTADRGAYLAREFWGKPRPEWEALRDEIAASVLEHGYNSEIGAFTACYDCSELDASSLSVGLSGLISPDDPRFISTVESVERGLRKGPITYRYLYDDGLPGKEGGFLICTAWLIEAYARIGRVDDAQGLFHQMLGLAGPTGLFSEEWCPDDRRALGNFPQAYSHLGVINAACVLANAGLHEPAPPIG